MEVFGLLPPYTLCGSIPDLGFDPPRCVSVWPMEDGQDFLLFGCASGSLRVARVMPGSSSNSGVAGNPDMQIRGLTLLPYGGRYASGGRFARFWVG